jgi:hypothetical protein
LPVLVVPRGPIHAPLPAPRRAEPLDPRPDLWLVHRPGGQLDHRVVRFHGRHGGVAGPDRLAA